MSTGGIGVTVGSSSTKMTDSGQSISSVGSTVGSVLGNVSMTAGEDLRVQGAEVLAGKDINLTGKTSVFWRRRISLPRATPSSKNRAA